jgi:MFS family permease
MKVAFPSLIKIRQNTLAHNSIHLYLDMLWYGVLTGSTMAFLSIYAARIGASAFQIGMINGAQAVVNLIVALPAGHYLSKRSVNRTAFLSALLQRVFYGFLIFVPMIFSHPQQMVTILVITFIMWIPGTAQAISFNALFADSVPAANRGHVAGIRNAVLSITTIATTLICGQLLTYTAFPVNYQIVFGIGFFGAAMSTMHLWFVRPAFREEHAHEQIQIETDSRGSALKGLLRFDVLQGKYGRKIFLLFGFHFVQYLGIAIFPIYQVNIIHISDFVISIGTSIFYISMFLVSIRLEFITRRFGYSKALGFGIIVLGFFPALLAMSTGPTLYYIANIFGGMGWGFVGGTIYNYILEAAPPGGRAGYLSWYNLVFNAGILLGSVGGPLIGQMSNLHIALWIVALGRIVAGIAVFCFG